MGAGGSIQLGQVRPRKVKLVRRVTPWTPVAPVHADSDGQARFEDVLSDPANARASVQCYLKRGHGHTTRLADPRVPKSSKDQGTSFADSGSG